MIKKFLIPGLVALMLGLSCASCTLLESMFADKVVTTISNVKPENRADAVPADMGLLPKEVATKLEGSGETLVIVDKGSVVDLSNNTVDISDPGEGWLDGAAGIGLGIASTLFPGVAALEGLGLLFSRRKRKHYGAAVTAAVPVNGKLEIKDAVLALGRAIGVSHSSESSKAAFEEEGYEWVEEEEE